MASSHRNPREQRPPTICFNPHWTDTRRTAVSMTAPCPKHLRSIRRWCAESLRRPPPCSSSRWEGSRPTSSYPACSCACEHASSLLERSRPRFPTASGDLQRSRSDQSKPALRIVNFLQVCRRLGHNELERRTHVR